MDARGGGPAKPENRDYIADGPKASKRETLIFFDVSKAIAEGMCAPKVSVPAYRNEEGEDGANGDYADTASERLTMREN